MHDTRRTPANRRRGRSYRPRNRRRPPILEPDASGSWRDEYRAQAAPVPDGGRRRYILPDVGARVIDREEPDEQTVAIVVDTHPTEWAVDRYLPALEATVAELNPDYDDEAPVVTVAFPEDLAAAGIDVDELRAQDALEHLRHITQTPDVRTYDYPADRLRLAPEPGEEGEA